MQIYLRKMCDELYDLTETENCSSGAAEKSRSDEFEVGVRILSNRTYKKGENHAYKTGDFRYY